MKQREELEFTQSLEETGIFYTMNNLISRWGKIEDIKEEVMHDERR